MEVQALDTALIMWSIFSIISVMLFIIALTILLTRKGVDARTILPWTLLFIFLPTIGPVIFFKTYKRK